MALLFLVIPPALLGLVLAMDPLERWASRPLRRDRTDQVAGTAPGPEAPSAR